MGVAQFVNPFAFFALLVLGAVGVCLALPRRGTTPQILGALIAGLAGGAVLLSIGLKAGPSNLPNLYFYIFSLIGLGSALRVITHPRPVYAALYFIMSVLATAGLFLILSAEFMAFALIIVYAGAILITYLFVIMLATQAPEEGQEDVLAEYDTSAREPIAATVVGFLLLGLLSAMLFRGAGDLPSPKSVGPDSLLAEMPRKVERVLKSHGMIDADQQVVGALVGAGRLTVELAKGDDPGAATVRKSIPKAEWPEELRVTNPEMLGFNFLREHPGTIEIAGVILLMAMLGAVVLSRKQVQLDDEAKQARVTQLAQSVASQDPVSDAPYEPTQQAVAPSGWTPGGSAT
jgi:NADH-quinone oxidoreductase subunit J